MKRTYQLAEFDRSAPCLMLKETIWMRKTNSSDQIIYDNV